MYTMVGVNRSIDHAPPALPDRTFLGLRPVVGGTACCVVSALGYAGASICMRWLAELKCDPMWAVANKELVAVVVVGPWLLWRMFRRLPVFPSGRALAVLVGVSLAVQLGANLGVQWSFGVVGLAVAIPAIFGIMLTASAVLGWMLLGERVSRRSAAAIGVLLVSLVFLGLAAGVLGKLGGATDRWTVILGVAIPCLAGAIYAVLMITIRHTVTGATPVTAVVFVTTSVGVLTLGPLSLLRLGVDVLRETSPEQYAWMLVAGTLNLIAFLAITKGLELTTAVHANVLNASQVAMAAIAGMLLFREPLTVWLIIGVCWTIAGIVLYGRPEEDDREADRHM